ncbi:MAG: D-tyrosyl-tRNA(Tyr) deacylase [Clostridia bacterium]|nr:D-tyrosyl-tRNA(Tyr) deacylase [Clostridia bacterium]
MIAVLQRVSRASVSVDGEVVGKCEKGLAILLGVADGDLEKDAEVLAEKISKLRIFTDENDKMNLSVMDIDGEALVISNFTLLANYAHGNRPDYMSAAKPSEANRLYEYFCDRLSQKLKSVEKGVFGADMAVEISNDGPVTIVMDSKILVK